MREEGGGGEQDKGMGELSKQQSDMERAATCATSQAPQQRYPQLHAEGPSARTRCAAHHMEKAGHAGVAGGQVCI